MRIAYLVNQYPSVSHSFIRREIQALEKLGLEIERFTIRRSENIVDESDLSEEKMTFCIIESGWLIIILAVIGCFFSKPIKFLKLLIMAISFGLKNSRGVKRNVFYLFEAVVLYYQCKKKNVEHLHSHFGTNSTTVAMFCKLLGGPNYSFTAHGPEEFDGPYSLSLSEKIINAEFVIAISNFARSQLMRLCKPDMWDKIKVVHCTVDESFLSPASTDFPGNKQLVCVGRLSEQKGQIFLLKAIKEINDKGKDVKLVLAGDGDMREDIEQMIIEFGLQDVVEITGWLTGEEVISKLNSSVALVLPSFAEGLPVVIMEALALNRPVISTYIAGIPELVDSDCGILVPAGDLDALVNAIIYILDSSISELVKMGKTGSERVRKNHNAVEEAKKIKDIIYKRYNNC